MYLHRLEVRDFRNYARVGKDFPAGVVVLHGPNGAGKTNLLEAVCAAASGDSPRARTTEELVRRGCGHGFVKGEFAGDDGPAKVEVGLARTGQRQFKVNGVVRRRVDLIGVAPTVYFSAEDIEVVRGEPAGRRRLLDRTLCSVSAQYDADLGRYRRAVMQRNQLLKALREKGEGEDALAPWDRAVARYGARVMVAREEFIAELAPEVKGAHAAVAGDTIPLLVEYRPAIAAPSEQSAARAREGRAEVVEEVSRVLERALVERRAADVRYGATGWGPHRDDIALLLAGEPVRVYGSQGEQRSCAVGLRLGLAAVMRRMTGKRPMLLLDDVLSELDARRRAGVFAACADSEQVIITCCDEQDIPAEVRESGALFAISEGQVS